MQRTLFLTAVLLVHTPSVPAIAADLLTLDFEQGPDLARYDRIDLGRADATVVEGGADSKGHCLRLETPKPDGFCAMDLKGPVGVQKNLILAFDHREEIEAGGEGATGDRRRRGVKAAHRSYLRCRALRAAR
jgi:hypothetical protein